MRGHELNDVRICNPDGLYGRFQEPNRVSVRNMGSDSVPEDSSRAVRERVRVGEFYKRRRRVERPRKRREKRSAARKASRGASMAGHALLVFTAVVFCSVVYVSSLTIRVRPCSSMATALAFQTWFRNPDETPLRATLYSESERYSKDFVGVAYLLFEGLEKKTTYGLSIENLETEEKIYSSTFLTAEEDPYQIQVENPTVTEEGLFQFSLSISGLEGAFYTVYVMDENGKTISVTDHSEAQTSFSIPIKSLAPPSEEEGQLPDGAGEQSGGTGQQSGAGQQSGVTGQPSGETGQQSAEAGRPSDETEEQSGETERQWDMDELPFVTVKIDGKIFLPRVWESDPDIVQEGAAAPSNAESAAEPQDSEEIEWVWNDDRTEAEALIPNPENPEEKKAVAAEITETVAKEPQCEEPGLAVYELSATDENGTEYSDVQTAVIPPTGHSYERVRLDETASGTSAEYVCAACGKTYRLDASATEEPD